MCTLLRRLPVKPFLSSFRCTVSKPLCSLVDNITSFVPKDEIFPNSHRLIAASYSENRAFYSVNVDSMYNFTATEKLVDRSLKTLLSDKEFLGSCNGLVALWKAAKLDEVEDEIFLWNPTTREIRKLPRASNILIPRVLVQNCLLGFGYDHVNDDYKVMRTCRYPDRIVVSVYSLKNNSWARAEDMSTSICLYGNFGVSANGSLYWIGEGNVAAFDLVVHSHRELQFPAGVDKKNAKFLWQFNGSLCVVEYCPDSRWDIWVMNKNGVEDSWSKLLTLEKSRVLGSFEHVYPVAFSKSQNEIILVVDRNRLVWYDCENDIVKNIALCEFPESFELFDYNERCFQISDSKLDGRQSEEEEKKQREHALRDFFQEGGFKSERLTTEKDIKYAVEKVMERAKKKKGSFG